MNSEPEASLSRSNAFLLELHSKITNSEAERRDCPEPVLFYQNCIEVETIQYQKCMNSEPEASLSRSNAFLLEFCKNKSILIVSMAAENQCISIRLYSTLIKLNLRFDCPESILV